jgi:hypothetical protein
VRLGGRHRSPRAVRSAQLFRLATNVVSFLPSSPYTTKSILSNWWMLLQSGHFPTEKAVPSSRRRNEAKHEEFVHLASIADTPRLQAVLTCLPESHSHRLLRHGHVPRHRKQNPCRWILDIRAGFVQATSTLCRTTILWDRGSLAYNRIHYRCKRLAALQAGRL